MSGYYNIKTLVQRAFTHIPTFTFVVIECAVQPDKRMHSKMILTPIGAISQDEPYDPLDH